MEQGIYIALSGAKLQELRLEIVSNNLSNASTSGYKENKIATRSFNFDLEDAFNDIYDAKQDVFSRFEEPENYNEIYSKTFQVGIDFSQGYLNYTGSPLNIALEGPGFFAIETPQGIRYTRQGDYHLTSDGNLVTSEGYPVRGKGLEGLGEGEIFIDSQGTVLVDGNKKGSIDIVEFENPHMLKKEGHNMFVPATERAAEKKPDTTTVKQGFLEMPNMNVVENMVRLIELNRLYESYQKTILAIDESTKKITNELGTPD